MGEERHRRGVTWRLAVAPEVLTEYAGTCLHDYYTDAATMLRTQQRARERFLDLYGVEVTRPHLAVTAYVGAAALGGRIVYPKDTSPMVENQGRVLSGADAAMMVRVPAPKSDPVFAWLLEAREYIEQQTGVRAAIPAGQEGPVTTAMLLRGQGFLLDLYEAPEAAHHLLDVVTDTYLSYVKYAQTLTGEKSGTVGIADDFAGLISPRMWPEFVVPYWRRILEGLGADRRVVHSELLRIGHLPFLSELRVDHFDPGADQYLTGPMIRSHCDIPFTRYLLPVDDLTLTTPEGVRRRYEEEVAGGAGHIDADISGRGIPHDNVRAFVNVARGYE